jgi:hypothetical protein
MLAQFLKPRLRTGLFYFPKGPAMKKDCGMKMPKGMPPKGMPPKKGGKKGK